MTSVALPFSVDSEAVFRATGHRPVTAYEPIVGRSYNVLQVDPGEEAEMEWVRVTRERLASIGIGPELTPRIFIARVPSK